MTTRPMVRTATIALSGTTSNAIPLRGRMVVGFRLPAALDATAITFTGSEDETGTYAAVYDSDGNAVSAAVAASRFVGLSGAEADALAACPFIKLVSNAGGGESAARSIVVVLK